MPQSLPERYDSFVEEGRLKPDDAQRRVVGALGELAARLDGYSARVRRSALGKLFGRARNNNAPTSVYIHGDVGRGKTLVMDLFHEAIRPASKRRVHFHRFMQEVHGAIAAFRKAQDSGVARADRDPIEAVARQIVDEASVLCLDEFQVKDITDAMILGRLFEALLDSGVVCVATSNIAPRELYRDGLNRQLFLPFIELIESKFQVISLDGEIDYRLEKLAGEDVYFCPLGPGTDGRVQLMWHNVTGTDSGEPATLEVQGRKVNVPQAARRAARFEFADLCERPLGNADYLAISETYDTVFIERVPELARSQGDAARRFINLIDTLYDGKARTVISAETGPEGIFRFADTPVEFARTVSRLKEMQSADWWRSAGPASA